MAVASPLPLAGDGSARFLPWLVALMVFLAAIATCAAFAVKSGLDRWDTGLRGTLTVQLPASSTPAPDAVGAVLDSIRQTAGVASAEALDTATTQGLLKPWLGDDAQSGLLPIPTLIDVHLADGRDIDRATLEQRLAAIVPGATVERRGAWLDALYRTAHIIELGAAGVVLLIGAVAVIAVIFTTRTGLALHAHLIGLLHLMGATDAYVARQFQWHAFRLALRGGIIGIILAFLSFGALKLGAEHQVLTPDVDLLPGFRLPIEAWVTVMLLPLIVGGVGLVTARWTVLRALARMP